MRRATVNIGLGLALLISVALNVSVRRTPRGLNVEFAPDMARTARHNAFEPNAAFADGLTLRTPMAGTIPRGLPPLTYAATRAGAMRAGDELVNPFSRDDRVALERGARIYADFCAICHGKDGLGNGPVVQRGFRRPPNLSRPFTSAMKDGQYFHVLTYGQGLMASYASQLSRDDRWKVILHLRVLQERGGSRNYRGQEVQGANAAGRFREHSA